MSVALLSDLSSEEELRAYVAESVARTPIIDLHTHLYPASFGPLALSGIDNLLTYHYLIAEVLRARPDLAPAQFYSWSRAAQAELIWDELFVRRLPVSEACRGVVTVLDKLGVPIGPDTLALARERTSAADPTAYAAEILALANVSHVVMTNDPLDAVEHEVWHGGGGGDEHFLPALRIDSFLLDFAAAVPRLQAAGYAVANDRSAQTQSEAQRWLRDWVQRMRPVYLAASMPPDFQVPAETMSSWVVEQVIMPICTERNLPWAVMPGVRRQVNPALGQAGDGVANADLEWIRYMCATYPQNRFLITVLARENQHELCVLARKFSNLLPFGCWWFLNNPSLIEEMTRMRMELLGLSFVPQHSDSRILEQLIYKWDHFRPILVRVLGDKLVDLQQAGLPITRDAVDRDVEALLAGNFREFVDLA